MFTAVKLSGCEVTDSPSTPKATGQQSPHTPEEYYQMVSGKKKGWQMKGTKGQA